MRVVRFRIDSKRVGGFDSRNEATELMITHLCERSGVLGAMKKRWPNPILATVYFRAPFNDPPRSPLQVSNYVSQAARFLAALPKAVVNQQR